MHTVPVNPDPEVYLQHLNANTKHVGDGPDVAEWLLQNPYLRKGRVASVYIVPDGNIHVINPHAHTDVASNIILNTNVPQGYEWDRTTLAKSEIDHHMLTAVPGFLRAQMYPNGVGVSIDMAYPPSTEQVDALIDYFRSTSQEVFAGEIYYKGEFVATLSRLGDMRYLLNHF